MDVSGGFKICEESLPNMNSFALTKFYHVFLFPLGLTFPRGQRGDKKSFWGDLVMV